MKRRLTRLSLPFRRPFVTSAGVVPSRDLVLLRIEDDDGAVGYGEAAPFEPYDGIPLEAVVHALPEGSVDADAPPPAPAPEAVARRRLGGRPGGPGVGGTRAGPHPAHPPPRG